MKINRFEDLEVWKNARELCKRIRKIANETGLAKDFSLKDQILRSSGSVMDNIAEGFERGGKKGFINFLYIAKGSLGETRSQVYRCRDSEYLNDELFNSLINDCLNLSGQIKHFINYLSASELEGTKRKQ
jgi:four helix bundle protein